ncbi:hypothetical protein [Defluviimonas sp. WL0075]|uniref:hypothetical protein n=1 Tax=Albidovulum sediminicola TaxID=2984331 RepID=UPI0021E73BDE|nr:hypothetical protein [Defluviimonas sp. WL0075]
MRHLGLIAGLALAGCVETTTDPGDGGFFTGVQNIRSGAYDQRVAEREQAVDEAGQRNAALKAEQASLAAQISATENELAKARFRLLQQRDQARNLDDATRARVNRVLTAKPASTSDAKRLADLQALLSETKALSAELAALSG